MGSGHFAKYIISPSAWGKISQHFWLLILCKNFLKSSAKLILLNKGPDFCAEALLFLNKGPGFWAEGLMFLDKGLG